LTVQPLQGDFEAAAAAETVAETPVALAVTVTDATNPVEWAYSATAEDNIFNLTEAELVPSAHPLDGQPGITFQGPAGATRKVHVKVNNLDISEGSISLPVEGDDIVAALFVNSDLRVFAPEGFTQDLDVETPVEFNLDAVVDVRAGDVLRVGLLSRSENTVDWNVAEGGEFTIK
jgi:hypothetical protein